MHFKRIRSVALSVDPPLLDMLLLGRIYSSEWFERAMMQCNFVLCYAMLYTLHATLLYTLHATLMNWAFIIYPVLHCTAIPGKGLGDILVFGGFLKKKLTIIPLRGIQKVGTHHRVHIHLLPYIVYNSDHQKHLALSNLYKSEINCHHSVQSIV